MSVISPALCDQVNEIIGTHLTNLGRYVPAVALVEESAIDQVVNSLERIAEIYQTPPRSASAFRGTLQRM